MRRWLLALMLLTISIGSAMQVRAQDAAFPATPLDQLGLPELEIETVDAAMNGPSELDAGRYHLTLRNSSNAGSIAVEFYRAPAGTAAIDLIPAFQAAAASNQPPPGFYDMLIAGGATARAGSSGEAVIDLPVGSWLVAGYVFGDGLAGFAAQAIEVTGDIGDPDDPGSDVDVNLEDFAFDMDDRIRAGNLVWEIENDGDQPHFITIYSYPGELTSEAVNAAIFNAYGSAPEPANPNVAPIDLELLEEIGGSGTMSSGTEAWLQLDLPAGTYLAFCQVADEEGGLPHMALGQFKVFTVE